MSERSVARSPACAARAPSARTPSRRAFAVPASLAVVVLTAFHGVFARADADLPPIVFADGSGLPDGGGTAREGAALYVERCASCHGASGEGGRALELVGERSLLASDYPDRGIAVLWPYAPPLYDYIRRTMPPDAPYSLGTDETYAIVARVLELNGLVEADTLVDAAVLGALRMPNRNGFDRALD